MICFHRKRIRILFFSLLVSLLALPSANLAQQKSDEVSLTVTVTDKSGQCADKLSKSDFVVYDGKTQQEITSFNVEDSPVSVGILIDVSRSITARQNKSRIVAFLDQLSRLIRAGHEANEYFLEVFGNEPVLLKDWTRDREAIIESLSSIDFNRKEATALYDACYLAVEKQMRSAHSRRVIILLTDGEDTSSKRSYFTLKRLLKESDVVVYSLHLIDSGLESLVGPNRDASREMCSLTGGKAFFPSTEAEIKKAFEQIAAELQCQYRIGFKPAARDGKWHSVKIKIAPNDKDKQNLSARYRPEYLASGAR